MISDLLCSECYGDGGWEDDVGDWEECDICGGTGILVRNTSHYNALVRWAQANGFVHVDDLNSSEDSQL